MDNFVHHIIESFNRSIKREKGSDSLFMIGPLKLLGPCQQNFTIVSFRTSTFKSCKELMSTSNTLTDSKSVETLKTHTQAYMVQTIVTHSSIRLEGNNLKQTDPLDVVQKSSFQVLCLEKQFIFKNGKMAENISSTSIWVVIIPEEI
jgi:hypothetical protein